MHASKAQVISGRANRRGYCTYPLMLIYLASKLGFYSISLMLKPESKAKLTSLGYKVSMLTPDNYYLIEWY